MSLQSIDILYYSLSALVIVVLVVVTYSSILFLKMLTSAKNILQEVEETTENLQAELQVVKKGITMGVLTLLGKALGTKKGGEKDQ